MTRVKFCGLRRSEDAALAVQLGAWALGMVMWPGSPRYCPPAEAAELAAEHRRGAEIAGVFVNATLDEVVRTAEAVGLSIVQLHGDEGQQYCEEVARRTGCKVIKAFRVRDRSVLAEFGKFRDVGFRLVDTYKAGIPGGTGETFDWSFMRERRDDVPLILSGGLTPENVADAVVAVRPFAVDVSSGVEVSPGVKDPEKMRAFVDAVRDAAPSTADAESEAVTGAGDEVLTLAYAEREAAQRRAELAANEQAGRSEREGDV